MDTRWKPSVTVAAIITSGEAENREFLLVEEETPEGIRLNNPAGHLEPGESPLEGCVREALEETARLFMPQALLGIYLSRFVRPGQGGQADEDITYLRLAFCGSVGEHLAGRSLDSGILRTVWMGPAQIRECVARHRSPLLLRCMEDCLAGQRFPLNTLQTDASVYTPFAIK